MGCKQSSPGGVKSRAVPTMSPVANQSTVTTASPPPPPMRVEGAQQVPFPPVLNTASPQALPASPQRTHSQTQMPQSPRNAEKVGQSELLPGCGVFLVTQPIDVAKPNAGSAVLVNNTLYLKVCVVLDFSSSTNVQIHPQSADITKNRNEVSANVDPESTLNLVHALPTGPGWSVTSTAKISFLQPDESYKAKLRNRIDQNIEAEMNNMRKMLTKYPHINENIGSDVVQKCKENGTPFIDTAFYPSMKSMAQSFERFSLSTVLWLRPRQFLPTGVTTRLLPDTQVSSADIVPGALGNTWLLCGLGLLADSQPALLPRIFPGDQFDADVGVYRVRFLMDAWFVDVVIDDYTPCDLRKLPIYGFTKSHSLWVSVAEKAYAKLHGSYQSIVVGSVSQALYDFTGFPCRKVCLALDADDSAAFNEIWNDLVDSVTFGYIVGAGTAMTTPSMYDSDKEICPASERYLEMGFTAGYTYTITRCVEAQGVRLVNIRNPWNTTGRIPGPWNDTSSGLWTPELRAAAKTQGTTTEGSTWLSYQEFMNIFASITICHFSPTYHNARIAGRFEDGISDLFLAVRMFNTSRVFITLSQKDVRGKNPATVEAELTDIGFFLLKPCGTNPHNNYTVQHFTGFDHSRDVFVNTVLEADSAPYIIVPIVSFKKSCGFVISLHYERYDCGTVSIRRNTPQLLRQCSTLAVTLNGEDHMVRNEGDEKPLLHVKILRAFRWLGVVVQNDCPTRRAIIEQLDFSRSPGYKICRNECAKSTGLLMSGLEIPPSSLRLASVMCAVGDRWGYDYTLASRLRRRRPDNDVVYPGEECGLDVFVDVTTAVPFETIIQLNKRDHRECEVQLH